MTHGRRLFRLPLVAGLLLAIPLSLTLALLGSTAASASPVYNAIGSPSSGSGLPVVTQQPVTQDVAVGATATFTSTATSGTSYTEIWQVSTNAGGTYTSTGTTGPTLTVPNAQLSESGYYYEAVFTNTYGTVRSIPAQLYVGSCSSSYSTCTCPYGYSGTTCSTTCPYGYTSTSTCTCPYGYTGTSTCTCPYSYTTTSCSCTGYYTPTPTSTSSYAPQITEEPTSETVSVGGTATFYSTASSTYGTVSETWQVSTNGGASYTATGYTGSTQTVSNVQASQNGTYYEAVFTNAYGTVTSTPAVLSVTGATTTYPYYPSTPCTTTTPTGYAPTITLQPSNQTVPVGGTATFTATATSTYGTPTETWEESTNGGSTYVTAGVTGSTLVVNDALASQNGYLFEAVFTNSYGTVTSSPATLTVTGAGTPAPAPAPVAPSAASCGTPSNQAFVCALYEDILGRSADAAGLNSYTTALYNGTSSRLGVAQSLLASPEHRMDLVSGWYRSYLGRAPDAGGLATYVAALGSGTTDEQVQATLLGSPEFYITKGASTPGGFITALYQALLNRTPAVGEVSFWQGVMAGGASDTQVAADILASQEYRNDLVSSYYSEFLGRPVDAGGLATYTGALASGMTNEQVIAQLASSPEYFNES